jgi:hypothetical protein
VIRAGYELLHLITFFTVGPKEARAWTVFKGAKAPQAAGVIHTDFEKGFIRAETMAYQDYVDHGGEAGAKEAGKWRSEGKDYDVKDGDIMLFRFNVRKGAKAQRRRGWRLPHSSSPPCPSPPSRRSMITARWITQAMHSKDRKRLRLTKGSPMQGFGAT